MKKVNWEFCECQPGNGTKYQVLFQKLDSELCEYLNYGKGATLVVFLNMPNRPSYVLPSHVGFISLSHFMEKTGISEGDAIPLITFIMNECQPNRFSSQKSTPS